MNIDTTDATALSITPKVETQNAKSKKRFQSLWEDSQRIKSQNQKLEESLEQLVVRIRTEVGPVEQELAIAMRVQIDKLIVFAGRKSIPQWQAHVLEEWILSTIDFLEPFGLVDDPLKNHLAGLQAKAYGISIDTESEQSTVEQLLAGIEDQLGDLDLPEEDGAENTESDMHDFVDWFNQRIEQLEFEEQYESADWRENLYDGKAQSNTIDPDQPQTVFKTLFHRVARALHPDKESDPEKIKSKQALMSQLLTARRQHDLVTVVQLYQEHVEAAVEFGDRELKELEFVLQQFIVSEHLRINEITTKSYLHEVAFSEFYSTDSKKINRAIKRKIKEIEARKLDVQTFSKQVTSLKKLKPYLEIRFDQLQEYF